MAQFIDTSSDRWKTPLQVNLKQIGSLKLHKNQEIDSWCFPEDCEISVGTLAVWDNYKAYLKPLGAK